MYLDIEIQKIILLYCENKNFIWKKKRKEFHHIEIKKKVTNIKIIYLFKYINIQLFKIQNETVKSKIKFLFE